MKNKILLTTLGLFIILSLSSCSYNTTSNVVTDTTAKAVVVDNKEKPEVSTVHWARANSGNIFVSLAKKKGYFSDYGINVIEDPMKSTNDAITGAVLDLGHDPINEIEWLTYSTNNDRISAVIAGEADYELLSGDLLQKVCSMQNQM